ncbi:GNAT family N-acetyltransferase [Agromyces sp. NPDC058110]|uniref:GNAT family N-acetyltransferase n=1 Tax=Agromyces sp. NPDC058110 TaxID=3346345 RepID=UPI0036D9492D
MSADDGFTPIEYPDAAGYPDGTGFLDEGTEALVDEVTAAEVRDVDRPSADSEAEIEVHRRDADGGGSRYAATIDGDEIASVRYAQEGDVIDVLTTSVEPEFRGRGIAADLIADALDDIRARGLRLVVHCPVVAAFVRANAEYADLLEPRHPSDG